MVIVEAGEMAPKQPNTGLCVGLNKGHVVTKKELAPRPSDRKGVSCSFLPINFLLLILQNNESHMIRLVHFIIV